MKELKRYHPLVITVFMLIWVMFTTLFSHPFFHLVCLLVSYLFLMEFEEISITQQLRWNVVMMLLTTLSNPLFQHRGVIILFQTPYFPVTLESLLYGLDFGCMLVTLINFMKVYSLMIRCDQILFLLQKVSANTAIVCSLSFQQIKQIKKQYRDVCDARALLYQPVKRFDKMKENVNEISALITWLMEHGMDTSLSMKARGFGKGKRTVYETYRFAKRDVSFMLVQVLLLIIALVAYQGVIFAWYPTFFQQIHRFQMAVCLLAMFGCALMPMVLKRKEIITWDTIISK